ncbi:MAG: N-acetylneuraminate synthase family protein [Marinirhabdus sp.]|nr:N-acetylneuraminate synthase family protein [Marinirhabdus sp.]
MLKSYVYAETAFHHEGDMDYIKKLIAQASAVGVNGIKFQVLTKASDFISTQHSAFETLQAYTFSSEQWSEIFECTTQSGLDIIMMPLDLGAFALLEKHRVAYLDIHSVSFYDSKLLEAVKKSGLPIILGVGGRTREEIDAKRSYFEGKLEVLMVGYQSFPSTLEHVNIGKIAHLVKQYPDLAIGYADHSAHDDEFNVRSNEYARLLGATFFEKHMTIDQGVERVDYNSAVNAETLKEMTDRLRFIEAHVLQSEAEAFSFHETETTYRNRQLVCVAARDLASGTVLTENDMALKMMDTDDRNVYRITPFVGKKIKKAVLKDFPIHSKNIVDE